MASASTSAWTAGPGATETVISCRIVDEHAGRALLAELRDVDDDRDDRAERQHSDQRGECDRATEPAPDRRATEPAPEPEPAPALDRGGLGHDVTGSHE
jgi:hypothetical protein